MMPDLPALYARIYTELPEVVTVYDAFGSAIYGVGTLDDKTRQLTKLALAVGKRLESATHPHTRRALGMGIPANEIKQVVLLTTTTLGFPTTVSTYTWVTDELDKL
ncbi:MAG: carboxymuconolactone decarboxylase family protein [Chloroflexi bacterium]|nr:carboxymuconolactone decarboxylase family protein [Chloroflexota bacterium]